MKEFQLEELEWAECETKLARTVQQSDVWIAACIIIKYLKLQRCCRWFFFVTFYLVPASNVANIVGEIARYLKVYKLMRIKHVFVDLNI